MRQYETVELSFKKEISLMSDVSIDLEGTFRCNEECVTVKGFYAGNHTFKVRFLPTQEGIYHYSIRGIISEEGNLEIQKADPKKHGILKADGTHVRFMDGSYFYPFGTTVYGLAHQTDELMEETLDTLSDAPFNKIRICVFPKHYQYNHNEPQFYPFYPLEGKSVQNIARKNGPMSMIAEPLWDVDHPDFAFWDAFEDKLNRLNRMGIVVDLILYHPYDRWGFSQMRKEEDQIYLDYLLRRFSAFPNLMWSMANEYDMVVGKKVEDWYEIEEYVVKNDPYHHMISNHNYFVTYDYGSKNITHVSIQTREPSRVLQLQKFGKPVFYDECAYEGNLEETFGSLTGEEMLDRFWKVTVSGGFCTHGETFIDYDQDNVDDAVVFWAKGGKLIGESPKRIAYLRTFVEALPGPIDPVMGVFNQLYIMSKEELQGIVASVPEEHRHMILSIGDMDAEERLYHLSAETSYDGHVGNLVYISYYGRDVHARITMNLPTDKKYTIEAIDTWNMTRETIGTGMSGVCQMRIPQKQWMAAVATLEE